MATDETFEIPRKSRSGLDNSRIIRAKDKVHYLFIAILAALLYFTLSSNLENPSPFYDIWEHLAALRELIHHPGDLLHPMIFAEKTSRNFSPYYLILSKLSVLWGRDVFLTYKIGGIINLILYSLFLSGFLGRAYGYDARMKGLALMVTLLLWGAPWMQSPVFSFNTLSLTAGYPSYFGFTMSLGSLYYLYGYLYQDSLKDLFLGIVLFFLLFISYTPVLPFYLVNIILIIPKQKKKILLVSLFFLSVVISFLWPLFPLISNTIWLIDFVKYMNPLQPLTILSQVWPSMLGVFTLFFLPSDSLSRFCRWGFTIFILLTLIASNFQNGLWGRLLLFSIFYLQIGFAAFLGRFILSPDGFRIKGFFSTTFLAEKLFAIFFCIICCYQIFIVYQAKTIKSIVPSKSYQKVASVMEDRAVLLSDSATGWVLPAYGFKVIVPMYPMWGIDDVEQRRRDVRAFLSSPEEVDKSHKILSKYHSSYILLNRKITDHSRFSRFGEIIYSDDFLVLIRVIHLPANQKSG